MEKPVSIKNATSALRLAEKKLKNEQIEEALEIYRQILRKYPKNPKARKEYERLNLLSEINVRSFSHKQIHEKLISLFEQKNHKKLRTLASLAIDSDKIDSTIYNILGTSFIETDQYLEGIKFYKRALNLNPGFIDILKNIALAYLKMKDLHNALVNIQKAIAKNKTVGEYYIIEADIYSKLKDPNSAIISLNKAIELNPKNFRAINNKGSILLEDGFLDEALNLFKQAIYIDKNYADGWYNLSCAYFNMSNFVKSDESIKKALNLNSKNITYRLLEGKIKKELNEIELAVEVFRRIILDCPNFQDAYVNLAQIFVDQSRVDEAESIIKVGISKFPNLVELNLLYAHLHLKLKDYSAAKKIFEKYAIPQNNSEAIHGLSLANLELGNVVEALELSKIVINISPECLEYLENLYTLIIQMDPQSASNQEFSALASNISNQSPKLLILSAINNFMMGNINLVKLILSKVSKLQELELLGLSDHDRHFFFAYKNFLSGMLNHYQNILPTKNDNIYHIGDSHCLTFAHREMALGDNIYTVTPKIVFGAKVYHLSLQGENRFKSLVKNHLESLPAHSEVILSFGEIDCRHDEGFVTLEKLSVDELDDAIFNTVHRYVEWINLQNIVLKHRLRFVNTPAAVYNEKITTELNDKVKSIITSFNAHLKASVERFNYDFIDVHKLTKGEAGFSNMKYHLDGVHLAPDILEHL